MRVYKVGIIGPGVISRTYVRDIQRFFRELQVVACAGRTAASAQNLAKEFDIPKVYTVEQLLADPEIDIVVNLTPPQSHVEINRQILEAGKHLFSEKPFAPTLEDAQALIALAEERGLYVGCAPDTFLASGLQSMRYYLDNGMIGKPFFVTANMTTFGAETWHPNPAPFYQKGAGPVMDMAPYYLSAIISLLGPIRQIAAFSAQPSDSRRVYVGPNAGGTIPVETPTHYSAILQMACGAVVNLNVSFDIYKSNLPMLEIYGDGGTLCYPDPNFGGGTPRVYRKEQLTDLCYRQDEAAQARRERFYDLPELLPRVQDYSRGIGVLDLAKAIDCGKPSRTGGSFICHVTEALEGLLRSAESGTYYQMKTSCDRPAALTMGAALDEI